MGAVEDGPPEPVPLERPRPGRDSCSRPHPHPRPRHRAWEALGLVVFSLALNLAGNGRTSLWDRDEPRYAECTREMRASGDWVRPRFNGEPRYQKPILIYWVMLAGTALAGDNPSVPGSARRSRARRRACSCF